MADQAERQRQEDFRELLEGLRTTLPAIQVLFGFLLIVPFQASFPDLGGFPTALYMTAFLAAAVASALLIAPSVHQRLHWLTGDRVHDEAHLHRSIWLALAGTVAMAIALVSGAGLVTIVVLDGVAAALVTAGLGLLVLAVWFNVTEWLRNGRA